jgi:Casein kinase II regulatory subunit
MLGRHSNRIWPLKSMYCLWGFLNSALINFSTHSYIITNRGMHAMYEKYRAATFGRCPHVFCQGQPVLPVGLSDLPRNYTVNVFCPRCHGLFFPKSTRQVNIDGAYFGTTFPHLYLVCHPVSASCLAIARVKSYSHNLLFILQSILTKDMVPSKPTQVYHPRVYGFKVNQESLYYQNWVEAQTPPVPDSSQRERPKTSKHRHGRK